MALPSTASASPTLEAAASPIQPSNRPNSLPGMVNGRLPGSVLVSVAPGCVADRAAAASLSLLLAEARASGVALGTEECYRPLRDQVAVQQQWTAAGNSACAAPVVSAPSGAVGTSIHGWGRATDFAGAD